MTVLPNVSKRGHEMQPLVETIGLQKYFALRSWLFGRTTDVIKAVDRVSLRIWPGESVGLVGETGSGKSTFGRCLLRILEPTGGEIIFEGQPITRIPQNHLASLRTHMQMVFQNPYSSLDPRMRIRTVVAEPLLINKLGNRREIEDHTRELLSLVGLEWDIAYRMPHELSGGQRQRVAIARALALHPKFLVLDEPTSALDVSVRAQVLNLLVDLQENLGLTYLFISHDLAVIRYLCNRVAIMYRGHIVEMGRTQEIFEDARHPYTRALLASVLEADPDQIIPETETVASAEYVDSELVSISDSHLVASHAIG